MNPPDDDGLSAMSNNQLLEDAYRQAYGRTPRTATERAIEKIRSDRTKRAFNQTDITVR